MSEIDRLTLALREAEALADPFLASKLARATIELSSLRAEKDALDFASWHSSLSAADAAGALIVKTSAHVAESAAAVAAVAATVHARAISAAEAAVAADTVSLGILLLDAHALVARAKAQFFAAEREAAVGKARAEAISEERTNFGIRELDLRAAERAAADARVQAARSEECAVTDQLRKDVASANSAATAAIADEKARYEEKLTAAIAEERARFESNISALRAEAELKQAEAVAKALITSEEKIAIALAEERERSNLMLLEARREAAAPRSSPPTAAQAAGYTSAASASEVALLSLNSEEALPSVAGSASASSKKNVRVRSMKAKATPLEAFPSVEAEEPVAAALDTRKRKPEGSNKGSRRLLKRANNSDVASTSPTAVAPDSSMETTENAPSASAIGESTHMGDKKHRARRRPNHVVLDDDDDQEMLPSAAPHVDSCAPSIAEPAQANERRAGRLSLRGALAEPIADLSSTIEAAPIMRASGFKSARPPLSSKGQENVMFESKGFKSLEGGVAGLSSAPAAPAFTIPVGTAWNRGFSSIGFKVPKLR